MMWKKKPFIIGFAAIVLITGASFGGIALASEDEVNSQPDSLMARVAAILGINQETIEDAFSQAQAELKQERLDACLQHLIDEGIITEDQAAEYKDWLESRPDISGYREEMQDWLESRPEIPGLLQERITSRIFDDFPEMKKTDDMVVPGGRVFPRR